MTRLKEIQQENKQPPINQEQPAKIISCQIKKGKLITQLDDGREVIVAVDLLTKWGILDNGVKPEQLKKYELQNEGRYIYFPKQNLLKIMSNKFSLYSLPLSSLTNL